jgi:hypothetical protein
MTLEEIPIPPAPPPMGATFDQQLWNAHWSYTDLLLRIEQAESLQIERAAIQQRHTECMAASAANTAALLGQPAPSPAPPPPFML